MSEKVKQKISTKEIIITAATLMMRENGFWGVGVDAIMEKAGLTAGGFYHYFKSKEDLLNQVLQAALKQQRENLFKGLEKINGREWLKAVIERYINFQHRDTMGAGCSMPALAADIARSSAQIRKTMESGLHALVAEFTKHYSRKISVQKKRDEIFGIFATCAGTILISRAMADKKLANQIIVGCKRFLLKSLM